MGTRARLPSVIEELLAFVPTASILIVLNVFLASAAMAKDETPEGAVTAEPQAEITLKQAIEIGTSVSSQSKTWLFGDRQAPGDAIKTQMFTCMKTGTDWRCYDAAYRQYEKVLTVLQHPPSANTSSREKVSDKIRRHKDSLAKAELAWSQFRDAEATADRSYASLGKYGTVINTVMAIKNLNLIRERIAETMVYYGAGQN